MQESVEHHRHATSGTHAKTHGVVIGELQVPERLPAVLAQGLFGRRALTRSWAATRAVSGTLEPDTEHNEPPGVLKDWVQA